MSPAPGTIGFQILVFEVMGSIRRDGGGAIPADGRAMARGLWRRLTRYGRAPAGRAWRRAMHAALMAEAARIAALGAPAGP